MQTIALVMAGGIGLNLWPRSTEKRPKQFAHVSGDGTLIQNTVMRLMPFVPAERIFVVTTQDMVELVSDQLPLLPSDNILVEPFGRNTAPCILLATMLLRRRFDDDTVMVVIPSDHVVANVREFQVALDRAATAAGELDGIVTLGIVPTRPETGFGYIQTGEVVETRNAVIRGHVAEVRTFAEKPDAATAQRFMDAGDFVWNSGMFVARLGIMQRKLAAYLPDHAPLFAALDRYIGTDSYKAELDHTYRQIRSVSFDTGVMEKARRVYVIEAAFGWSDVGTWDELYRLAMKDGKNNVIEGNVVTLQSTNCLVNATTGRIISLVGVDNLVVVETDNAVLICPRGHTHTVRDLVDLLRRRHISTDRA
jgi:mannose-1-phosphate guanylyltransferase